MENEQKTVLPEAGGVAYCTVYSKTGVAINITARGLTTKEALKDLFDTIIWGMAEYNLTTEKPMPPQPATEMDAHTDEKKADEKAPKISLPEGVHLFGIKELFHDTTKSGKDVLKVVTVEAPYNTKYGVSSFHPNLEALKGWKQWEIGKRYAPPADAGYVVIRDAEGEGKYPDVIEFRATK